MSKYVMALDQGTTSSRAIIFDEHQNIVNMAQKEFTQHYPKAGWVEHDPLEIYASQYGVLVEVLARSGMEAGEISAIGITNQRETTIVWDKNTGRPVYNAIVWQCRRTSDFCTNLVERGYADEIRAKTGLLIDAYFSATKIKWILDNVEGARERAERGELLFGTVDTWLIWKLTGGAAHVTDVTNASRTMLFNIHTLEWDKDICALLDIPMCMLPKVCDSSMVYGAARIGGAEIPIAGAAGGCQAEIGTASAMGAAALCYLGGGDAQAVCHAAAIAIKAMLGLVCDPIAGLVEVPCVKRNAAGAVIAMSSADMALAGIRSAVPPDEVILAMREVGDKMDVSLKETGVGGVAGTPFGQKIAEKMGMA